MQFSNLFLNTLQKLTSLKGIFSISMDKKIVLSGILLSSTCVFTVLGMISIFGWLLMYKTRDIDNRSSTDKLSF